MDERRHGPGTDGASISARAPVVRHLQPDPGPRPSRRVLAVAAAFCVTLLGVGTFLAWRNYQATRQNIIHDARILARAAASSADEFLRDRLALLRVVAATPTLRSGDALAVRDLLQETLAADATFTSVAWIAADGTMRTRVPQAPNTEGLNFADRSYFRAVMLSGEPRVSEAITSRVTDAPIVVLAAPIVAGGQIIGVVVGTVSVERLGEIYAGYQIGVDGTIQIVDSAGQLLAPGEMGRIVDVSTSPLLQRARTHKQGAETGVTGLLGDRDRLVAFISLPRADWSIFVDVPTEELHAAQRTLAGTLVVLAALAAAGLGAAMWTGQRLDAYAHQARQAAEDNARLYEAERAARDEAEAALRLRDELVSFATHDLRTPLTAIRAFAQLLLQRMPVLGVPDVAVMREGLESIEAASARMQGLIAELLDTAHLHTGRPIDLHLSPTDLVALVQRAVVDQERRTTTHRFAVQCDLDELMGWWDSARLDRVVTNVLANAVKYSPAGGYITVRVGRVTDMSGRTCAVLSVQDEGIGIPAADLPYLFERFRRGSNVGAIDGTGIGLAVVRQIVEQHGGDITIASVEGQGTTVTIHLPVTTAGKDANILAK